MFYRENYVNASWQILWVLNKYFTVPPIAN